MSEAAKDIEERLSALEDKWELNELSELEYKEQKWKCLQELCERGQVLSTDFFFRENQETTDANGKEFCYVGAGPFVFGPDDQFCELKAPMFISKFPVTVGEFTTFLDESGYDYPEEDLEQLHLVSPYPDCPVSHVSWLDAKEYCRWLRKRNCEYYSLPHEIEWERAARGIDGRFYPWGNEDPTVDIACYRDPVDHHGTVPIDSFPGNRSPSGCIGMVGNVWEWCLDTIKDPRDPHILRGGSWCNPVDYSNCISRTFSFPPEKRVDYGGFRVVYLPNEMLIEYRQQYAAGIASSSNLTVVTHARRKTKMMSENPEWSGADKPRETAALRAKSKAKPAATSTGITDASVPDDELNLNELMADAISEAADIYRQSLENPQDLRTSPSRPADAVQPFVYQRRAEEKKDPELPPDTKAERKAVKKQEPETPEEAASPFRKKGEMPDSKPKDKRKEMRQLAAQYDQIVKRYLRVAMVLWVSLFVGLIALIIQKLITLR